MRMAWKNLKGQGATEYMILLGAVLVIAIGVVTLLSISSNISGDASITEAQLYWRSVKPISILDAKNLIGACGSADGVVGGYRLVITNSDPDPIYITGVGINGVSKTFCTEGAASASSSISVGTGKTMKIDVQNSVCAVDSTAEFSLAFTYNTPYLEGKRQSGTKKFAFKCAESCIPNGQAGTPETCCSGALSMGLPTLCICSDGFYPCTSDSQCCEGMYCTPTGTGISQCE